MLTTSNRARTRIVQSRQNSRVKELRSGFARPGRSDQGHISIEGEHLLEEAVRSGLRVDAVFYRSGSEHLLDRVELPGEAELLELPAEVFSSAVSTESPQGIAALVEPPSFTLEDALAGPAPLVVVAAGLQDPGNLGTLVRSAEAFGASGVLTLPGTVSLWNAKTLRASSGSAFRLPVVAVREDEAFAALRERKIAVLAAVAASGMDATACDLRRATALMIGNEGSGLPASLLKEADVRITITCSGPVESLNAAIAGSVLLYEASRQRKKATA